ncbi:MAPK/ERK kinase kinase 1 [Actinidia rufa]|uniref:mitogen-activated protein kinase kinase kinase n=1 Tax=Actinidia rufa TaxID=165716 RepID=A0A7J0ESK1_9ERIC|nr:MAPK/ERK kinase kinase 1 [Actinidia rufa]
MNAKKQQQKPKLDRRNANRNIDYDASPSVSSSFEDRSPLRTRSLDVSPLSYERTSFRLEGTVGEFDRICRSLGLSPEDFAIPAADWEARKVLSSFHHFPGSGVRNRSKSQEIVVSESIENGLSDDFGAKIRVSRKFKHEIGGSQLGNGFTPANTEARVRKVDEGIHRDHRNWVSVRSYREGGCGINGARPPVLAPPPAILSSVVDNVSSTWDIYRGFGPQDEEDLCSPAGSGLISGPKEENRIIEEDEEVDGQVVRKQDLDKAWLRNGSVVSESCSDTSFDDKEEDTFNMIAGPLYSVSPNGKLKRSISSWQKGDFLGSGSFGTVFEGFTHDGFFFAVKEVSLLDQGSQGKQSLYQLEQEISLLSQFEHENIVRYLGTDKDDSKLYIFLELVTKGSLASLYQRYNLQDSQVSAYTRQILHGLNYLHFRDVVHRDIKCANILVDVTGSVKLADFGLAKATKLNDIKSCKGTAFWMAPEVVNRKNHGYGLAADIWSLGCTVLEMLTHKIPYSHLEGMQALFRIGKGELPLIPSSLSSDAQDFIYKCLQVIPEDRPTAAQLLDHPFVKRPLSTFLGPASPYHNGTRA